MQILNQEGTKLAKWEYRYTPKTPKNIYIEDLQKKPSLLQKFKDNWHRFNSFSKITWQIKYLMFLVTPGKKTKKDKAVWKIINPHPNHDYLPVNETNTN